MTRILAWGVVLALACGDDSASDSGSDASADMGVDAFDAAMFDAAVAPPFSEPGRHDIELLETRRVITGDGLPSETPPNVSNNNLDIIRHDGRVYLAWRTGPNHFASEEVLMHVISSEDEITWQHEVTFDLDTDLREPRFLEMHGRLLFYFSILGTNRFAFEPMGVQGTERLPDGTWTDPVDIGMLGYVVWRTKVERGTPYMAAYLGGEHIYRFDGEPLEVELRTTSNGFDWTPISPLSNPTQTFVYMGGGSEMDFVISDEGILFGVIRNEAGDDTGWGSLVCTAPAGDVANWDCRHDPKKYDSPLMFWHDGEAYLIARRNVSETGFYDLGRTTGTMTARTIRYQTNYIGKAKRCALWRYVQGEQRIAYLMDLPSRGDTCFPAILRTTDPEEIVLYNYSSDIEGEDVAWARGQEDPTFIYRHVLRFTRN